MENQAVQAVHSDVSYTRSDKLTLTSTQLFNMTASVRFRLEEVTGSEMTVIGYYQDFVDVRSEATGELEEMRRIVLFLDDGVTVQSVSNTFRRAFGSALKFIGEDEFRTNGIRIIVKNQMSRGRNIYTVEIVE